ncbi:MAG: hypothetical protein ACT4PZ_04450 [Panacagrimonas sp.]
MITLEYPAAMQYVRDLTIGLTTLHFKDDPVPKLIVKVSKETILAARMNQEFAVYLIPYELEGHAPSLAFLAAFLDDQNEPLTAGGAFIEDLNSEGLRQVLLGTEVDVHFFDELNREMLGYRAAITITDRYRQALTTAVFPHLAGLPQGQILDQMTQWFSIRDADDDAEAITLRFQRPLFPEDYVLLDITAESRSYHGASRPRHNLLVRPEPGQYQERDIVEMLQRIFPSESIYWSPLRTHDREEIADVIVVTDQIVLLVQAKDSPNTEAILSNTVQRKRATIKGAIEKAIRQTRGAVRYLRKASPMPIIIDEQAKAISWSGKALHALIVVKELFDNDFDEYTPPILELTKQIEMPCIVLSFTELHQFTKNLGNENNFLGAYWRIFDHGLETGMFPRLRVHPLGTKLPG